MVSVRELIGGDVISVSPERTLREATRTMHSNHVGALAVEVAGFLEGILTERDIVEACASGADLDEARVDEWMTAYPDTFTPDLDVEEAANWMTASGYRHLPVIENGRAVGMISIKDVLWAMTMPKVD